MVMWSVPRMWPGRTVAILASAPSMSQGVADQVKGLPAIVINTTFRLAPWADVLYAADAAWWQHHTNRDAASFQGLKVSLEQVKDVLRLRNSGKEGFDSDPGSLRTGGNSGYQAVHLAVHAGAARILLCGFEMGGDHWHGSHPHGLRNVDPDSSTYDQWVASFEKLAPILSERGVEVINCTPGGRLECFKRMSVEDALAACVEPAAV